MKKVEKASSDTSLHQASKNIANACINLQSSSFRTDTTEINVSGRRVNFGGVRKGDGEIIQSGTITIKANGHEVKIECLPGYFVYFFDGKRVDNNYGDDNEEEVALSKIVEETAKGLESVKQNKDDTAVNDMRHEESKRLDDLLSM